MAAVGCQFFSSEPLEYYFSFVAMSQARCRGLLENEEVLKADFLPFHAWLLHSF